VSSTGVEARSWVIAVTATAAPLFIACAALARRPAPIRSALRALTVAPSAAAPRRRSLFEAVGHSMVGRRAARRVSSRASLLRRLELAGDPWSVHGTAGRMVVAGSVATAVVLAATTVAAPLIVLSPIAFLAGWRGPSFLLARRARNRQQRIESQVPELVELLVAGAESGLPPPTAFARSAEMLAAPLGDELARAVSRIRLGQPWRTSVDEVVARTAAPSLARLARALERSHRLGASVQGSLRALVEDVRALRRARAEERARRAPVKMLFPLVFLILPAFLLLTVGPVLLSTVRSLH
jgi:tight adherence protein C